MASKKTEAQVEFKANASGFNKGIREMDQSLNTLRKELKLNSTELKGNADDVELLGKRHDILQNEHDKSKAKVDALSDRLNEAKELFDENSNEVRLLNNQLLDAQNVFQGVKNELTQVDNKLNNLENGLSETKQEMKNVDNSTEQLSDGFTTMKGAIADLIADGVQQLSGALKDLVVDSDTAYSNFQAQTGSSTKEMEQFEGAIEEIYSKNYGESINDIANAMAQVKQQTQETDPSNLQKMTENALMLRDTFDMDVQESMRAVNMLMNQFGITGDEAFNLIVQGTQAGLNKNGDFLDSLNEYSVHYKQLGMDADEFITSLILGTENGAFSVDKVGDAMKEFGIRVKDTSNTTTEAFELIGLDADKMREQFAKGGDSAKSAMNQTMEALINLEDPIKRNQAGVNLFGSMWEDLGEDVLNGATSVDYYTDRVDSSKNSMEELTDIKMDNITSELGEISRQLQQDFLIPIGEELLPVLKEGLTWLKDNLNWLLPVIEGIGIAIATYFVVSKFMSFIGVITQIINLVKTGTTVFGALNAVMAINPIFLIISAVVGLIAVFVLLWNKCDGFREFWINLWEKIKEVASTVWEAIKGFFSSAWDFIKGVWESAKTWFSDLWNGIKETASNLWEGVKTAWSNFTSWINDNIIQPVIGFFQSLWEGIKAVWDGICLGIEIAIKLIASILDAAFQIITLPFMFIWENCKEYVFSAWEWIKEKVSSGINTVKEVITIVFTTIKDFFVSVWDGIKNIFTTVWNAIYNFIAPIVSKIFTAVSTTFNKIKNTISTVFNTVKTFITNVWNTITSFVSEIVTKIATKITQKFNEIKTTISEIFNKIKSTVSNVWTTIKTTISNLITSAKDKVSSVVTGIKDKVVNTFNTVKDKVTSTFNKVKEGITKPVEKARDTVKGIVDKIKGFFDFEFKLPKIKTPKFGITPKGWKLGDLLEGSIPKLSITWNKEGAIFRKPTLFDTRSGLQGVGEAGAEAVLPIEKLENWLNSGFSKVVNNNYYNSEKIERLIEVAEDILNKPTDIYMDRTKVGQAMAETNDNISGQRINFRNRGVIL